ncbi:MAG: cytochrome c nitrite reductase small subunit [Candidatus Eisenbacteria bacterium]
MRQAQLFSVLFGVVLGIAGGLGLTTFLYARGTSYLTNDPDACQNCHVMREQYAAWQKSSHHAVAVCNDCHAPHELAGKYATKATNGFRHSFAFTSGDFPEPIQITERNRRITEAACRSCHQEIVEGIEGHGGAWEEISCLRCHRSVGHMH